MGTDAVLFRFLGHLSNGTSTRIVCNCGLYIINEDLKQVQVMNSDAQTRKVIWEMNY